jgi:predicted metalloprotease
MLHNHFAIAYILAHIYDHHLDLLFENKRIIKKLKRKIIKKVSEKRSMKKIYFFV